MQSRIPAKGDTRKDNQPLPLRDFENATIFAQWRQNLEEYEAQEKQKKDGGKEENNPGEKPVKLQKNGQRFPLAMENIAENPSLEKQQDEEEKRLLAWRKYGEGTPSDEAWKKGPDFSSLYQKCIGHTKKKEEDAQKWEERWRDTPMDEGRRTKNPSAASSR